MKKLSAFFIAVCLVLGCNNSFAQRNNFTKEKAEYIFRNISAIAASDSVEGTFGPFVDYYKDNSGSTDSILNVIKDLGIKKHDDNLLAIYYIEKAKGNRNANVNVICMLFDTAFSIAKRANNKPIMFASISEKGDALLETQRLDEALDMTLLALKLGEKFGKGYENALPFRYRNLSLIYGKLNDTIREYEFANKAYQLSLNSGINTKTHGDYFYYISRKRNKNFGIEELKDSVKSEAELVKAHPDYFPWNRLYIAIAFLDLNQPDSALTHARIIVAQAENQNVKWNMRGVNILYLLIARAHKELGNIDSAIYYANKRISLISVIYIEPVHKKRFYDLLSEIHAKKKDYGKAFMYILNSNEMRDTLFSIEKNKAAEEVAVKYETEKKDNEIKLLASEKEIEKAKAQQQRVIRNSVIAIAALLVLVMAGAGVFVWQRARIAKQKSERQMTDLQMQALRAQMNPHFVYNCMTSIRHLIAAKEDAKAIDYLQKFASLLRLTLDISDQKTIPLSDEIQLTNLYIQLEALQIKHGLDYEIKIGDNVEREAKIPAMLIQPYVENAIKHGLFHKEEKGRIDIELSQTDHTLHCTISDNGIGREKATEMKSRDSIHKSRGMSITEQRLSLMSKSKVAQTAVTIVDLNGVNGKTGTRVELNIPLG